MDGKTRLAGFLRARRSQLRPEDVGVPTYGERRRVPGLRREELALLAGVSTSYYTRLEQGQSPSASPEVLDAIAGALRLDEAGRRYLHDIGRGDRQRARSRRSAPERVTEATRQLLDVLDDVPTMVLGRRSDALAWNRLGHALFAGHLDPDAPELPARRPNMARMLFLDSHARDLYADWPGKARGVVANLRLVAAEHPEDVALHALLGELSAKSAEFASMWAEHRVKPCTVATHELRHPLVGPLTVVLQTLTSGPGPNVVVATTEAGSPSRAALALLAQATGEATTPPGAPSGATRARPRADRA